jgi:FkbM family methyltransferase
VADLLLKARRLVALYVARPYFRHELPGWGWLYKTLVGGTTRNADWQGLAPRRLKGKLHGYHMQVDLGHWSNRKTFFLGRFYDLPTQLVLTLALREGDTFVDIGANEGMMTLTAARLVGPRGRVIAFEPNPAPRGVFERAVAGNGIRQVDIRPCGLGDVEATLELSVPKVNSGEGSFSGNAYADEDVMRVQCPVRIGDRELAYENPRLIKIDVEGFEEHVLRGLRETIARARPLIVMEMVSKHLRRANSSVEALASLLSTQSYRGWQLGLTSSKFKKRLKLRPAAFAPGFAGDVLWIPEGDPILATVISSGAKPGCAQQVPR